LRPAGTVSRHTRFCPPTATDIADLPPPTRPIRLCQILGAAPDHWHLPGDQALHI
jgi:hypothetical protein